MATHACGCASRYNCALAQLRRTDEAERLLQACATCRSWQIIKQCMSSRGKWKQKAKPVGLMLGLAAVFEQKLVEDRPKIHGKRIKAEPSTDEDLRMFGWREPGGASDSELRCCRLMLFSMKVHGFGSCSVSKRCRRASCCSKIMHPCEFRILLCRMHK